MSGNILPEPHSKRGRPLLPADGMDTGMGGPCRGHWRNADVPTRLKDMDTEGIDVSVLFPTSSFAVNSVIERAYAVAYARAYNDFIAEVCRQSPRLRRNRPAAVSRSRGGGAGGRPRRSAKLGLAAIAVATQGMKEHLGLAELLAHLRGAPAAQRPALRSQPARRARRREFASTALCSCIRSGGRWRPSSSSPA